MINLARLGNKYLADENLGNALDAPERVPTIMHIALQIAAALKQFRLLFYAEKLQHTQYF